MSTPCRVVDIPGPPGVNGAPGAASADGANAYGTLLAPFFMPAIGGTVTIEVDSTAWMVPSEGSVNGQALAVEFAGTLLVAAIVDGTHVTLYNPGYTGNCPAAVLIPIGARIGVSGIQGQIGASPGGALLAINNLSDVLAIAAARANLGLGSAATSPATDFLTAANNLSDVPTKATARTNLGLTIGTNVEAWNAFLDGFAAAGPGVADQMAYLTAANTFALTAATAPMRALLANASVAALLVSLGRVKERSGLLGLLTVNLNGAIADQNVPVTFTRAIIRRIVIENASVNLTATTARFGIYTGSGKTGTTIVTDPFDPGALTASTKFLDLTLAAGIATDVVVPDIANSRVYFYLSAAHGVAATANIWIFGEDLS